MHLINTMYLVDYKTKTPDNIIGKDEKTVGQFFETKTQPLKKKNPSLLFDITSEVLEKQNA